MREAANFLNAMAEGGTLADLRSASTTRSMTARRQLDDVAAALIAAGLAMWDGESQRPADRAGPRKSAGARTGRSGPYPHAL